MRAFRVQMDGIPATAASPHASDVRLTLPDKPSIAVLPFENMSGDPEQEYFVDGLVEDIITGFHASSRSSSSPDIRPSRTRVNRQTSGKSGANSGCAMYLRVASVKWAIAFASADSS